MLNSIIFERFFGSRIVIADVPGASHHTSLVEVFVLMPSFDPGKDYSKQPIQLSVSVHDAIEDYFKHMEGENEDCDNLYGLVLSEVERPLLQCVMAHCGNNRTLAAKVLGINRATLRKKLDQYKIR